MAEPSTNLFWGSIEAARAIIAGSAAFQTLTESANAPAALAHIYTPGISSGVAEARPFAVVDQGDARDIPRNSSSSYTNSGSFLVILEADVPALYDDDEPGAHQWFFELLGDIVSEVLVLGNTAAYLAIRGCRLREGPARADPELAQTEGDFYQVVLEFDWGPS